MPKAGRIVIAFDPKNVRYRGNNALRKTMAIIMINGPEIGSEIENKRDVIKYEAMSGF